MSVDDRFAANVPLVSVLLPTHNRPEWLAGAVRSVIGGEFADFELIVSNNGDPEHTRRLAREIPDPRIRWVEYDRSSQMIQHFLSLIDRASGKYMAILHDHDWWHASFLAKLVPALEERPDAVLAFVDHHEVDAAGVVDERATDVSSARFGRTGRPSGYVKPFFDVAAHQSAPITGSVIRRDALDLSLLPAEAATVSDLWMIYQLAGTGGAAYYRQERLLYLRVHETTATSGKSIANYTGAIVCREQMLRDPRMGPYADVIKGKLAHDHMSAGAALLRQNARRQAREHLVRSLRLRPHPKAVGGLVASWVAPAAVLSRI